MVSGYCTYIATATTTSMTTITTIVKTHSRGQHRSGEVVPGVVRVQHQRIHEAQSLQVRLITSHASFQLLLNTHQGRMFNC